MSIQDATPSARESVVIPVHLLPWLQAAADDQLELACDAGGEWTPDIRARVLAASRMIDELDSGSPTPQVVEHLASRLAIADEPLSWPRSVAEVNALVRRLRLLRQILALRDAARLAR